MARLIVRHAVDPAAVENADPFEGEGAESGLMLAFSSVLNQGLHGGAAYSYYSQPGPALEVV
jgi:hypothetical protein